MTELPTELKTCKAIGQDITAIEQWAQIFTNRTKLIARITRNMALHHKEITDDISTFETDFKAAEYFKAGEDVADLLAVAVGTVEVTEEEVALPPVKAIPEFIGGLLDEFVEDNNLSEIEACAQKVEVDPDAIEKIVQDIENKDWPTAITDLKAFVATLPDQLKTCESITDDLKAVEAWAKIFTNKEELIKTITEHLLLHKKEITDDLNQLKTDFTGGAYFKSGKDAALVLDLAIGKVKPVALGPVSPAAIF